MKKCDTYRIYFNLHNGLWSIKDVNGLVVGHAEEILLTNVTPVVSEAGRKRVLEEKRKNVHAYLKGQVSSVSGFKSYKDRELQLADGGLEETFVQGVDFTPISYNPYRKDHFFYRESEAPYTGSRYAFLDHLSRVTVAGGRVC